MTHRIKPTIFSLFILSGFCSLLYQVIWLRLAFASFGTITPVLSVLISVFMTGLAVGSFFGGRFAERSADWKISPIVFYGFVELIIGMGAFAVPALFKLGEIWLLGKGQTDSGAYMWNSALIIFASVLPWCIAMGATIPLMMSFIRKMRILPEGSFSYLYLANALGAMAGTGLTAMVLVELMGFQSTLRLAACCNFAIAATSFILAARRQFPSGQNAPAETARRESDIKPRKSIIILFATGFLSMAMEIIWTRAFTPILKTTIYSFALLMCVYLLATWLGSFLYRRGLKRGSLASLEVLAPWLALFSVLPLLLNDQSLSPGTIHVAVSIFPFCAALGYLTPRLIDTYSHGVPERAGKAYAWNVLGCILGPLAAGYIMLPLMGVKWSMVACAIPFVAYILAKLKPLTVGIAAVFAISALWCTTFEDPKIYGTAQIRRDHTATVISCGEGRAKKLLVNGMGVTGLTPITKFMAHFPLATLSEPPQSALVICFGMGTTFRSAMSWGIRTTAVELVPSVRDAFGYYYPDDLHLMSDPRGRVVVDDGRRFLKRDHEKYDLITMDPPPPVEASGSSLLYSTEFYSLVKSHLTDQGLLQQWFPAGETKTFEAICGSVVRSFAYVTAYKSVEGWGHHILAADHPIEIPGPEILIARMPPAARTDLMEWFPEQTIEGVIGRVLSNKVSIPSDNRDIGKTYISDDKPINEYYLLRRVYQQIRFGSVPITN
jgi:spermidine synthase